MIDDEVGGSRVRFVTWDPLDIEDHEGGRGTRDRGRGRIGFFRSRRRPRSHIDTRDGTTTEAHVYVCMCMPGFSSHATRPCSLISSIERYVTG